jgi:general secretion pathway protein I
LKSGTDGRGFTLVEVLVALTIVAVALMASLRAVGSLSGSAAELRARTLAQWSADNRLTQIRVQREWPNLGRLESDCSQAELRLVCEEQVFATPNAQFRRVEITVFAAEGTRVQLAKLIGFATTGS